MIADKDNKHNGQKLLELLQKEYPSYHPLVALARLAHSTEDDRVEMGCHATIAKYIEPELKSIEVRANIKQDHGVLRIVKSTEAIEKKDDDTKTIENGSDFKEYNISAQDITEQAINSSIDESNAVDAEYEELDD